MPDIFQYTSYREFLSDYFCERKKEDPSFTHLSFAQKNNIKSSGFVLHVMKGQRNLTRAVALNIARTIGLTTEQTEYFEDLIYFDQAKAQSDKEYYSQRISAKRKKINISSLDDLQYQLYSEWYHNIIRELVPLLDTETSPERIARLLMPQITPIQAKKSLALMEKTGILKKEANGKYNQAAPFIISGGALRNTALVKYQKQMLQHTIKAWDEVKPGDMTMHTMSLSMSKNYMEKVREEIRGFKERLMALVADEENEPERVYHMNINLFPVTKKNNRTKKDT